MPYLLFQSFHSKEQDSFYESYVLYLGVDIIFANLVLPQNRDYNRTPTSVGTFDVNGAAHVASRILAAILLASENGVFNRVLLGSSLQKLDYQGRYRFQS